MTFREALTLEDLRASIWVSSRHMEVFKVALSYSYFYFYLMMLKMTLSKVDYLIDCVLPSGPIYV